MVGGRTAPTPHHRDPLQTQGGISYVETAYAKNVGLPVASVVNAAGVAVQPTSYNVAEALTAAILYSDLTQNLGGVYTNPNPATYPISAYSYFVAQCVPAQAAAQNFQCDSGGNVTMGTAQGAELSQFIAYVACLGQSQHGRARLFAHTAQPGRRRLPGRRATPGGHDAAGADAPELPEPLHHRCAAAGPAVRPCSRRPTPGAPT